MEKNSGLLGNTCIANETMECIYVCIIYLLLLTCNTLLKALAVGGLCIDPNL